MLLALAASVEKMHGIDWTEVQTVVRVAKLGSLSAAARELAVNHSTILRRIQSFEEKHHVNVFIRDTKGYRLSRHGRALLQDFDTLDLQMSSLQRRIVDYDAQLQGKLTITSTENIFSSYLQKPLFDFAKLFPGVELDLLISNQLVELTQLEADIAIRPMNAIPPEHVGYSLLNLVFYFYAPKNMVSVLDMSQPTQAQHWIGFSGVMAQSRVGKRLTTMMRAKPSLTANSFNGVAMAANAGLGIALLPDFMGDELSNLQRMETDAVFETPVFAIAPSEIAVSKRVSALLIFLQNYFNP